MINFTVRRLRLEDIERGFFETLDNLIPVGNLNQERAREIFEERVNNPVYNTFVAENEKTGEVIGTATILIEQKFLANGGRMGHVEDVATRKGFENQGIATALLKVVDEEARKRGCFRVVLSSNNDNVLFYEARGFTTRECAMWRSSDKI